MSGRSTPVSLTVAIVLFSGIVVFGRQQSSSRGEFTIRDNVNLVLLDVSVKRPQGGYVSGLKKQNFVVSDDGALQTLTQFAAADVPITVGLVVDNSGSMLSKRQSVVMSGLEFARSSNPHDEFFVVNFNDNVYFGLGRSLPFTDNLQLLRDALFFGRPVGRTALYDAIAAGLKHLEQGHNDIRTLIVVSDGGDNVSQCSLNEVNRLIEASRATVYTIGILDPEDRDLNPKVLRHFASISGGEFFAPERLEDLHTIFRNIAADLRNRYSLAFVPDSARDLHHLHTLKVSAHDDSGQKLTVHARTAYLTAQ